MLGFIHANGCYAVLRLLKIRRMKSSKAKKTKS